MSGYIPDQQENTGSFIETTAVLDVARLYETDVKSDEFKELLGRLFEIVNSLSLSMNTRDFAFYLTETLVNSQSWYNPNASTVLSNQLDLRPAFRKVINCGAINAGLNTIPHGLTIGSTWQFVYINGTANNPAISDYYPLPFAGFANNNIELRLNATDVIIDNNSGKTFTSCNVVVEFLKF